MLEYNNKQFKNYKNKTMLNKKINFYDPVINAYREIPVEIAKKYVKELENIKKQLEPKK